MDLRLSIIAPCFNEERNVWAFYEKVCEVLGGESSANLGGAANLEAANLGAACGESGESVWAREGGACGESLGVSGGESGQKMPDSLDSMGGGGERPNLAPPTPPAPLFTPFRSLKSSLSMTAAGTRQWRKSKPCGSATNACDS